MIYQPTYFPIEELVNEDLFLQFKDNSQILYSLFDLNLLQGLDWIRRLCGPAIINNWESGGKRQWSGLRTMQSPYYRPQSMHSVGQAVDLHFTDISAADVRQKLKAFEKHDFIPFWHRIEDDVSWTHLDTKFTGSSTLYFFKP